MSLCPCVPDSLTPCRWRFACYAHLHRLWLAPGQTVVVHYGRHKTRDLHLIEHSYQNMKILTGTNACRTYHAAFGIALHDHAAIRVSYRTSRVQTLRKGHIPSRIKSSAPDASKSRARVRACLTFKAKAEHIETCFATSSVGPTGWHAGSGQHMFSATQRIHGFTHL